MLRAGMTAGCLIALAVLGGCAEGPPSYEPASLTELPPGGDAEPANPPSAASRPAPTASPTPTSTPPAAKPGELAISCATLGLVLPASWKGSRNAAGLWTYALPPAGGTGKLTIRGTYTKATGGKTTQRDLETLARGTFGAKAFVQVRPDGTVAGKGKTAVTMEWRLARAAAGSTQVVVVAYSHPGAAALPANVSVLDKAVGRATLSGLGTC